MLQNVSQSVAFNRAKNFIENTIMMRLSISHKASKQSTNNNNNNNDDNKFTNILKTMHKGQEPIFP